MLSPGNFDNSSELIQSALSRVVERVMRELDNLECLLQLLIVQIHFFYSRPSHVLSLPIL